MCEQERVIHECMKMREVKLREKRMIRLESVHAKETTVWVYKMKSIFQVSILIAIALVCGSTFTMAGEPLSMDQLPLSMDQLVDEKWVEVHTFTLKMLEVGTEKSLENQCDDFVTKLLEGFTNDVKDKINCKLAGKCGRESVLLDIEDAPALGDLFRTAKAEADAIDELENPPKLASHLASVKHMNRSDAAVKKIVQGAEASKEALSAASAIVDGKLKNFAMAKQVIHKTMQEINDILDHIADTSKIVAQRVANSDKSQRSRRTSVLKLSNNLDVFGVQLKNFPNWLRYGFTVINIMFVVLFVTLSCLHLSTAPSHATCTGLLTKEVWNGCKVPVPFCQDAFVAKCDCALLEIKNYSQAVLPESFGNLSSLVQAKINNGELKRLPKEIGNDHGRLVFLSVTGNRLEQMPDSVGNLNRSMLK